MKILTEYEAEEFLEKNKFPVVKRKLTKKPEEVNLPFPVALKVASKNILHKSETGGIALDLRNKEELQKAYKVIQEKTKKYNPEGILAQEYIKGQYLIVGLKKDETFGHVLALGTGGIYTEILKDITFRVLPIKKEDIQEMIKELKSYPILKGARNNKEINFKELEKVLLLTSELAKKYPEIKELDINPLIVNSQKAIVADARIIFE